MKPIIRVEGLSKQYRIGAQQASYLTLRDSLTNAVAAPFRHFRNSRNSKPETRNSETIWALKDVNFEINPGEVVGIIGRNGAGKSTLLKILSRITAPTTGKIDLYGRVGSLLEVGTGFHPELTGRENIYLNGAVMGMKREEIKRRFDEIVAFAEVEKFLDAPVKYYSSGMYMRLAFSVAAHLDPEILVVDEVLAVGDGEFQKKCLGKMEEVATRGLTVMFVSHNIAAIQQLCSRALLIRSGVLAEQGATEKILANYLNDASRSLDGVFDFTNHPARSAKHQPIIRQLKLLNAKGISTTQYCPDDSLVAEITLEPSLCIRSPRLAISIEDNFGRRITTVASYFHLSQIADIKTFCRVRCIIPKLNLGSGSYLISVSIADNYSGLLDSLHNAGCFEVDWRNNYGNGELYYQGYGPVLTASFWELVR